MNRIAPLILLALVLAIGTAEAKPTKKQTKVNVYVEMLNNWSPFMSKGSTTYTKWANAKTGPTCTEKGIRGPGGLGDSAPKTFAGFKKNLRKKPTLAADAAAMAMAEALSEIIKPVTEASNYYHKREYKKDDCKRGKELHPKLMAAWSKYFKAEAQVRKFVVEFNDQRAVEDLAKTKKKYGKKNRYHHQKLIADGKTLIRIVDTQMNAKSPDTAAIEAALKTFTTTRASAMKIIDKANKRDASVLYQGGFKQMANHYAKSFEGAVTRVLETYAKRDEKRFNQKNLDRDVKSSFDSYNRMIDASNKVRFSKQIK